MQILRNMNRPEKGFENWEEISEQDITLSLATYTHIGISCNRRSAHSVC